MNDFLKYLASLDKCSLTWFEKRLIEELFPFIKEIIKKYTKTQRVYVYGSWPRYDNGSSDIRTVLTYKEKIDRIVRVLDSSDQKREKFLENFPEWEKQRKKNIEELKIIAESLKEVRTVSNVVKIAAGGVGLAGGAAIIGTLLFPPAAPALVPAWLGGAALSSLMPSVFLGAAPAVSSLAVAGGVAAAGGAVGNVGASITELVLTDNHLDEAKKVIAKDRQLLEKLGVVEFFDELNQAIDNLFGESTSSQIMNHLIEFLGKIPSTLEGIQPILNALRICLELILPAMFRFLLIGTSLASVVLSIFFVVFITRRRGCTVILNHRLALGLVSAVDAGVEITRLIAAAGLKGSKFGELIPRVVAGKIAVGAIAGVGIALDVATIVMSSIDLAEGSKSGEISMLLEVANKLQKQLNSYQSVNEKLKECVVDRKLKKDAETNWTEIIVLCIPRDASRNDIVTAVNLYLPDEAWGCIKLERLPTAGNNWLVKVPTSHAQSLLRQSEICIQRERCLIFQ